MLGTLTMDAVIERTLSTLGSDTSKRVYADTYHKWLSWCKDNNEHDANLLNVETWLMSENTTLATRQRQLSAMRKLSKMLFVITGHDAAKRMSDILAMIKAPRPSDKIRDAQERTSIALTPAQADKLLRVWSDGDSPKLKRNNAMVAVMLLCGLRRAEVASLQWQDIDFANSVLTVRHGKGDKKREVPIAGNYAIEALKTWKRAQTKGHKYVFTSVHRYGSNSKTVDFDSHITGTDVYRTWQRASKLADVKCKPHDARHTLITELLDTGTPIHEVQAIAGHSDGKTTLDYAKTVDARDMVSRIKIRYG
jgi:integrase